MRLLFACLLLVLGAGCHGPAEPERGQNLSVRFLANGETQGYARATAPREFVFPLDHASHPTYRTEWWYFTGNLFDDHERHYGFELTFFRIALSPDVVERESEWGSNQVWMAHLAVTDSTGTRFIASERLARGALGLAGATSTPFRLWVEDWSVVGTATAESISVRLTAQDADTALDLHLVGIKPAVAHGDRGLDAKGPEPGNASFYYSIPRLEAAGTIRVGGAATAVRGLAWLDREWGTSALSEDLDGWDWFALQLSDGRDLMFYRLRNGDGSTNPFSSGSLIDARGVAERLSAKDVQLEVVATWQSPKTGVIYPVEWLLKVPRRGIELTIDPYSVDQELDLSVRYWEGAVHGRGTSGADSITANGYLELAGY